MVRFYTAGTMEKDDLPMIVPAEFPELALLVWNRNADRPITRQDAFSIYERNWRFVDAERLTDVEKQLIDALKNEFGHGRLLVS